jgi:hypothetical protein
MPLPFDVGTAKKSGPNDSKETLDTTAELYRVSRDDVVIPS